ncbi:hypothetical protein E2C01_030984 [Portunus trituberculatus]|uniref:Uncharacterized protein n=1 Tax=Portunus trituberculatus TaxID=210409 RepID=A0A5B7ETA9_PORTR|nr:hypothetical protein [Portunus trituberculatus]
MFAPAIESRVQVVLLAFKEDTVSPAFLIESADLKMVDSRWSQAMSLRPIISQIPCVSYSLAKRLKEIITPFTLATHSLKSTSEFFDVIKASSPSGIIASLNDQNSRLTANHSPAQVSFTHLRVRPCYFRVCICI